MNPTTHAITTFTTGLNAGSLPGGIWSGSDGNVWMTDQGATRAIARVGVGAPAASIAPPLVVGAGQFGTAAAVSGRSLVDLGRAAAVAQRVRIRRLPVAAGRQRDRRCDRRSRTRRRRPTSAISSRARSRRTYPLLVVTVSATSAPVTVFTAASLTQGVLAQTQALLAGAGKHDAHKLTEIVRELTASLDPSLWVDGNHVDAKHGHAVFDRDKHAVKKLMELQKSKESTIPDATLQGLIDTLVHADRVLAEVALADATAASGDPHKLAQAQNELAKAAADLASGRFDHAIEHYGKAWKKAEKA